MAVKARQYGGYSSPGLGSRRSARGPMSSKEFFSLLRRRARANAAEIDHEIESRCVDDLVILASDSSGFSRKTREYGIIQFLAVMTQCYDVLIPLLEKRRGVCLSHNADNILAVFRSSADAVRAALDVQRWCLRRNEDLPDAEQFNVCIGIHHGKLLRLSDNVFGDAVNIAAKLGEDIAARDEIIVTERIAREVGRRFRVKPAKTVELGGRAVKLCRVVY